MRANLRVVLGAAVVCACSHSQPAPTPAANPAAAAAPAAVPPSAAAAGAVRAPSASASSDQGWIARSNENTKILLAVQARFAPEQAARLGQPGLDDRITDLTPGHQERLRDFSRQILIECAGMGGALFNEGGTVVITNSTITGNTASGGAGGRGGIESVPQNGTSRRTSRYWRTLRAKPSKGPS